MRTNGEDYSGWIPALNKDIYLYYDNLLDRWVISGLHKIVFLTSPSYEVLRRCDGKADVSAICQQLCDSGVFQQTTVRQHVIGIIQDFNLDGFILPAQNDHAPE